MAIRNIEYVSLKHTLISLKRQVRDSLPYMDQYIPDNLNTPGKLFYYLKSKVEYKKDPKDVELLQMVPTLFDNDGRGDCDCFTILTLASCIYLDFQPQYVVLVGNSKKSPTHIYSSVWDDYRKKICAMDLTNPLYCMERSYKYKQTLDFNI
jgi:hypothetical protein